MKDVQITFSGRTPARSSYTVGVALDHKAERLLFDGLPDTGIGFLKLGYDDPIKVLIENNGVSLTRTMLAKTATFRNGRYCIDAQVQIESVDADDMIVWQSKVFQITYDQTIETDNIIDESDVPYLQELDERVVRAAAAAEVSRIEAQESAQLATETASQVVTEEAERVRAETSRVSAEQTRVAEELERAIAESWRVANESRRQAALELAVSEAQGARDESLEARDQTVISMEAAEAYAGYAVETASHPPIIGQNGNWFYWETADGEYVDSGQPSRGTKGDKGEAANIDNITPATIGAAPESHTHTLESLGAAHVATYSAVLSTNWTVSGTLFSQTINVPGILITDEPIVDIVQTRSEDTDALIRNAWKQIAYATCANGTVTFYFTKAPSVSVPIHLKVVR